VRTYKCKNCDNKIMADEWYFSHICGSCGSNMPDWYVDIPNESGWYWVNNLIYKNKYYDGEFLVPIVVRFVKEHNSIYVLHTNYEEVLRFDVDMDITCEWSDKINPPIDVWEIDVKNYVVPVNTK
jgi:hypothetical protein